MDRGFLAATFADIEETEEGFEVRADVVNARESDSHTSREVLTQLAKSTGALGIIFT